MRKCTYGGTLDELLNRKVRLDLRGAEGENDGGSGDSQGGSGEGNEGKGQGGDGGSGSDGDKSNEGKGDGDKGDKEKPEDRKLKNLEEERDRHYDKRREAEREADKLREQLAEAQSKGVTDEQTKDRLQTLERTNGELTSRVQTLAIENAFYRDNSYDWQNPAAAMRLVDLSRVEIDKDGKANGLKVALDKLAKDEPWLLKPKESKQDDEGKGDDGKGQQRGKKSGDAPGGGGKPGSGPQQAQRQAELKKKYPALRTH